MNCKQCSDPEKPGMACQQEFCLKSNTCLSSKELPGGMKQVRLAFLMIILLTICRVDCIGGNMRSVKKLLQQTYESQTHSWGPRDEERYVIGSDEHLNPSR